jgi:hypothetical protein
VTVAETLLVFVGAPLAVIVLLALLIFLPGGRRRPRWRAGQPWEHEPVWFEPHPGVVPAADHSSRRALEAGTTTGGGPLGGARGTW